MKKKILIVDCNAKIGGIQKALIALLKQIHDIYDVTLLFLNKEGPLLLEIPKDVRILTTASDFRYMGMSQGDCRCLSDKLRRGTYAWLSKMFGRKFAVMLAAWSLPRDHQEEYDVAISYTHIFGAKSFFGGSTEYVLRATKAKKKLCYIHCDYQSAGTRCAYSDVLYAKFDGIVCVSRSTRKRFIEVLPQLCEKTYAVLNSVDESQIAGMANQDTIEYDPNYVNLLSVARLTREKGIARMMHVLSKLDTAHVKYYVVGDGIERTNIEALINELGLRKTVILCGEDVNPYRYMRNADLLIVPSYHEAAPVVFQEARILQLPVLTTRTLSADEMVGITGGFVIENDDSALEAALCDLLAHPEKIQHKREKMAKLTLSNGKRALSLEDILE